MRCCRRLYMSKKRTAVLYTAHSTSQRRMRRCLACRTHGGVGGREGRGVVNTNTERTFDTNPPLYRRRKPGGAAVTSHLGEGGGRGRGALGVVSPGGGGLSRGLKQQSYTNRGHCNLQLCQHHMTRDNTCTYC